VKTISLCVPVWGRYILTEILFREWIRIFREARELGVECQAVVIGDDRNLILARELGFATIVAPNVLGSKYNDGHEWALAEGFDFTFQVNSDQVFDPRLLAAIADSPDDQMIQTRWLTSVHRDGHRAIATYNPLWAMTAYPTKLLQANPRPCDESIDRLCDTGVRMGIEEANPGVGVHEIEIDPLETIQFESPIQLTPWGRHLKVALMNGTMDFPTPWEAIRELHGAHLVKEVMAFYNLPPLA
jgi:hypothetical protein